MTDEKEDNDRGTGPDGEATDETGDPDDGERTGEDGRPDEQRRAEFSHDPVEHVDIDGEMTVADLVAAYGGAGFGGGHLHEAVDIYAEMLQSEDVLNVVGLAGAMVPAGMRQIVVDLIRDGHIDVLVTTGATLTHDTIEAIGGRHHHGRAEQPGRTGRDHDEQLRTEGVDRIYDVYLPQEHFAAFESHLRDRVFPALEETVSIERFTVELGRANAAVNDGEAVDADPGIAAAAVEADVPVYCPAVQDSILGLQAWLHSQVSEFSLDALADMQGLNDLAYHSERAGALVIGGGVPKNYVLQTMLVVPDAYDYGVQLTMDPSETGGLSGASLDEARSWGKLEPTARNVTVRADATITFPLLVAGARSRLGE